jgi:hypothetical protein
MSIVIFYFYFYFLILLLGFDFATLREIDTRMEERFLIEFLLVGAIGVD